ncbi:DUF4064 domain-containing protein [Staphylococcus edaphicus]|uniref:DUF4064 domain-containing protein n=1 Tax=Staphylococcus edaphicus TaxID=1955013 RepID=A0A2C6WN91_9STAP|nr:DUF4064 domain-containing protein [Staphylococcus edaphicus]PHK48907.1 hypothetical protein BTJ66_11085 [Staphylococcus edaphicus]UQW81865.1 DUF4064 domain-containing protein [Staphylococcus edaphicus]
MKRTAEKILIWIGIMIQFVLIFLMAIIAPFFNDVSVKNELTALLNSSDAYNQNATQTDPAHLIDLASNLFIAALIVAIIATVIAMISALLVNKLPKLVGMVMIILGIITILVLNWITAILWLVAGILLLARKNHLTNNKAMYPKENNEHSQRMRNKIHGNAQYNETVRNKRNEDEEDSLDKASPQLSRQERNKK